MIEIPGDILEGGGQILRNAAALSCILGKAIHISNIRGKRSDPGLKRQHLCGLQLLAQLTQGCLEGGEVGSTEVILNPDTRTSGGEFKKDVGSAGSLVLLLQASLPVGLFGNQTTCLHLTGGTNADMAPPIEYFMEVFLPTVRSMGVNSSCVLHKRGFYPKGGGSVTVNVHPLKAIKPINLLERGEVKEITGFSYVSGQLRVQKAEAAAKMAERHLRSAIASVPINIRSIYLPESKAVATGSGLFLVCTTSTGCLFGGTGIGKKGKSAEDVGLDAANQLLKAITELGCVDEHLQDQLIILMALADGKSAIRSGPLTLHTETAIEVARLLTGVTFHVDKQEDGTVIVSCNGIGYLNSNV